MRVTQLECRAAGITLVLRNRGLGKYLLRWYIKVVGGQTEALVRFPGGEIQEILSAIPQRCLQRLPIGMFLMR